MYNINELSSKAIIELIEIAKELGIPRASRQDSKDLIYKILDAQAKKPSENGTTEPAEQPRQKRTRIKPVPVAESNEKNYQAHRNSGQIKLPKKKKQNTADSATPSLFSKPLPENSADAPVDSQFSLNISDVEIPVVPEIPSVLSEMDYIRNRGKANSEPKQETAEPPAATAEIVTDAVETPQENAAPAEPEAPKHTRGRKPKKEASVEVTTSETDAVPSADAEPEKVTEEQALPDEQNIDNATAAKPEGGKKRGRKSKKQNNNPDNQPASETVPANDDRKNENNQPNQPNQNNQNIQNSQNSQNSQNNQTNQYNQNNQNGKQKNGHFQNQSRRVEFPFEQEGFVEAEGVLELAPEGFGYLRSSDYNYLASPDDILVSQQQVRSYGLKTGDTVRCTVRPPRDMEKYFPLVKVLTVNGLTPDEIRDRIAFESLTPLFPQEKFNLTGHPQETMSTRIIDLFTPIGKGQRGLIVAQPKTGKTTLLKEIANAIAYNHPEVYLMVLLIDERHEIDLGMVVGDGVGYLLE